MLQFSLATIGLVAVIQCTYRHYRHYEKLKAENAMLRQQWKKSMTTPPSRDTEA